MVNHQIYLWLRHAGEILQRDASRLSIGFPIHCIARRRANRDLDRPRLDLDQVQQAHRIADKVILDRANWLSRKVSRGGSWFWQFLCVIANIFWCNDQHTADLALTITIIIHVHFLVAAFWHFGVFWWFVPIVIHSPMMRLMVTSGDRIASIRRWRTLARSARFPIIWVIL